MFNYIIINEEYLLNNIWQVKQNNPNSKICLMVKANAYGVGAKLVVKKASKFVDFFGVACFFEAKQIKRYTNKKILIVGPLPKEIDTTFSYTCSSLDDVKRLINTNKKINIHLKVNSGMNRFGFKDLKEFSLALKLIKSSKLNLEGVFTHFATDDEYVNTQMLNFSVFLSLLSEMDFSPIIHSDNSAVNLKFNHHLDMVRIGFNVYNQNDFGFKSVATIKSTIVQINNVEAGELVGYNKRFIAPKKMQVAIIPIGYADGFDLKLIGFNLNFKNKNCKVLNICMDCFMLDVTDLNLKVGEEIFILNSTNSIKKYAKFLSTSEYEILTKFSSMRAKRILKKTPKRCLSSVSKHKNK